jgi:hypothetical protein
LEHELTDQLAQRAPLDAWSEGAKATYTAVKDEHPDLDATTIESLLTACAMISSADVMQAQVDADGLISRGSQGQPVAHPLIAEIRLARVQALAALRTLGLAVNQSPASRAGAALAGKRYQGVRSGRPRLAPVDSIDRGDALARLRGEAP